MPSTAIDFDQLDNVQAGDELIVRFTPHAYDDFIYIKAMNSAGVLDLSSGDLAFYEAVAMTSDWGGDDNRTQTLKVGSSWNRSFFEGRMRRVLESLEVKTKR